MSKKERRRLVALSQVESGHLSVAGAGRVLGLSERQMRRIWRRYQSEGDAGLVHRLRDRPGNRRTDASVRDRALRLYQDHYRDFGCTLACEYLAARHGLVIDDQTLRRWLIEAKLWRRRRKSPIKRRRRERRECFGQLVQLDGSEHDWFKGRRPRCVLMVMIDDATSWTLARFFEAETTQASMTVLRQWSLEHGLPLELYPDRHSIYRVNTQEADEQARRTGKRPLTQFGRALAQLGVKLTCAKSPQAKGRVERMNGTLQDRLVKALRLDGLNTIEDANAYLAQTFLPALNARFAVESAHGGDVHQTVSETELDEALCFQEQRTVGRDHCVSWRGQVLQLKPNQAQANLSGKRVTLRQSLNGAVSVHWRDQPVPQQAVAQRPQAAAAKPILAERVAEHQPPAKPAADHPWRGPAVARRSRVGPASATGSAPPHPPLRQPQPAA